MAKGSDGNVFHAYTPWHRDYLIRTKSIKVLIYLEENNETNGALRVIPGTHFIDDSYSSYLGAALTWPHPPVMGGFDEKGFFGKGHNPCSYGENQLLPQTAVRTRPGDVIIFNHNLIHCTNAGVGMRRRRLLGLHFCANPNGKSLDGYDQQARDEIRTLSLVEMDSFKLPKMFGPHVYDHPSPIVQKMILPLKDLSLAASEEFNGLYSRQSEWSLEFCSRLQSNRYTKTLDSN